MDAAEALVPIAKALEAKVQAPESDAAVPKDAAVPSDVAVPEDAKSDAAVPKTSQEEEEEDGGWWEEGEEEEWYEGDEEEHLEEDEEQWEQWDGQAVVGLTDSPPPKAPASQT